jgi:hypothetical protein
VDQGSNTLQVLACIAIVLMTGGAYFLDFQNFLAYAGLASVLLGRVDIPSA